MSQTDARIPPRIARHWADRISQKLEPFINKLVIVGSLGREEEIIRDIDLLVSVNDNDDIESIRGVLRRIGDYQKGGDKWMQVREIFGTPYQLDLFICRPPDQWGCMMANRMNPKELVIWSKERINTMGYERDGSGQILHRVYRNVIEMPREEDWFDLVGLPYVPPKDRKKMMKEQGII